MSATLEAPRGFGVQQVHQSDASFLIYHPAQRGFSGGTAPIEMGSYPLLIFAHGQREIGPPEVPADPNPQIDYQRWGGVLQLLARTGIVAVSVPMVGLHTDQDRAADRIQTVVRWMYERWEHEGALARGVSYRTVREGQEVVVNDRRRGPVGLAGHSWGIGGCVRMAARHGFVRAVAGVAATWREDSWRTEAASNDRPTLMVVGAADDTAGAAANAQPYPRLAPPRHLAVVQAVDHWDWFDHTGLSPPASADPQRCRAGFRIAGELVAVFFHRYLAGRPELPPSLLTMTRRRRRLALRPSWQHDTANRPDLPLLGQCAVRSVWSVPGPRSWDEPVDPVGTQSLGSWTDTRAVPDP